jgi:spore maturation protein CgeB
MTNDTKVNNLTGKRKVLIFDGLGFTELGKQLYAALQNCGYDAEYIDDRSLKKKSFYNVRSSIYDFIYKKIKGRKSYTLYPRLKNSALKLFYAFNPDVILIISSFAKYFNKKSMLKLKKKLGCKLIIYDTDSGMRMAEHNEIAFFLQNEIATCDQTFSCSKRMTEFMQQLGYKQAEHLPFGSKIIPLKNYQNKKYDVCFVGHPCMRRVIYLEKLKDYNLKILGKRWTRFNDVMTKQLFEKIIAENIWDEELFNILTQTKIILNINHAQWAGINAGVNLRVFETLAARSLLLTEDCSELHELFAVGQELETFRSPEELKDKVDFYLKHDHAREKIAKKGYEKFLKHYTWEKRITELMKRIKD